MDADTLCPLPQETKKEKERGGLRSGLSLAGALVAPVGISISIVSQWTARSSAIQRSLLFFEAKICRFTRTGTFNLLCVEISLFNTLFCSPLAVHRSPFTEVLSPVALLLCILCIYSSRYIFQSVKTSWNLYTPGKIYRAADIIFRREEEFLLARALRGRRVLYRTWYNVSYVWICTDPRTYILEVYGYVSNVVRMYSYQEFAYVHVILFHAYHNNLDYLVTVVAHSSIIVCKNVPVRVKRLLLPRHTSGSTRISSA